MKNETYKSLWLSAKDLVDEVETGDILQFESRKLSLEKIFPHWGIYMGLRDGIHEVGHVTRRGNLSIGFLSSSSTTEESSVRVDNLLELHKDRKIRINNSLDKLIAPLSSNCIVSSIRKKIGRFDYSFLFNNCKDFVKWARYGLTYGNLEKIKYSIMLRIYALRNNIFGTKRIKALHNCDSLHDECRDDKCEHNPTKEGLVKEIQKYLDSYGIDIDESDSVTDTGKKKDNCTDIAIRDDNNIGKRKDNDKNIEKREDNPKSSLNNSNNFGEGNGNFNILIQRNIVYATLFGLLILYITHNPSTAYFSAIICYFLLQSGALRLQVH